jgi:predicted O-methyltransferase YrrM
MGVKQTLKEEIQRRFPGLTQPPPPVSAQYSAPSMLFSPDENRYGPTERLLELAVEVIPVAHALSLEALRSRNPPPSFETWPGEHYRLLAALVQVLQPQVVIEIGTYTGLSALAMKPHLPPGAGIATFDINAWNTVPKTLLTPEDFEDGTLVQYVEDLADPEVLNRRRTLLECADLIFIDGPHDGETEAAMVANLRTIRFDAPPILVLDDVRLWTMLKFWRELALPKLDFTSFGHWSGTGLADWADSGAAS